MYRTREEWLNALLVELRADFREVAEVELPERIRLSIGYTGSTDRAGTHVLGACWNPDCSADKTREIFIVPELDDPIRIGDVAVHELCHAALPFGEGHKASTFGRLARAMGLEGKLTSTFAGDELRWRLHHLVRKLGPLPHARLNSGRISFGVIPGGKATTPRRVPRQGTRMLKVECGDCGCIVRMTRKWLDEAGSPTCGCGGPMDEVEPRAA